MRKTAVYYFKQLSQPSPKSNPNSNLGLAGQHNWSKHPTPPHPPTTQSHSLQIKLKGASISRNLQNKLCPSILEESKNIAKLSLL